jgi:PAS domain S-box-containing protein
MDLKRRFRACSENRNTVSPGQNGHIEHKAGANRVPIYESVLGRVRHTWWQRRKSLRARLFLLVVASVVPLVGIEVVHEYRDYARERQAVYDTLLGTARGLALVVERDLQLRVASLQTLAMSQELRDDDLDRFDQVASTFLAHQPEDAVLGLATQNLQMERLYGRSGRLSQELARADARGLQVFKTGQPVVSDLHINQMTGGQGFSIDVPVTRDGRIVYDLSVRLTSSVWADLIGRQYLPPGMVLTVIDISGNVVARLPSDSRFVGAPVGSGLWSDYRGRAEGISRASASDGTVSIVGFSQITPFGWVVVGAPEEVILAPIRAAIIGVGGIGMIALITGLALTMLAARGITRPIEQLRRLAAHDEQIGASTPVETGLPEADMVARALVTAAAERHSGAKALAESETRFRELFEKPPTGTILTDPETTQIIDSNTVAAAMAGCTVAEFCTHAITDFALKTHPDRIRELSRSVERGANVRYETRIQGVQPGPAGQRDLLVAAAPVLIGGRTLVLLNTIDVTDLRRAEAGARVNEERLELARHAANLGIWDWDVATATLTWNTHQWDLHGLEPRSDGPTPELWCQVVHPADQERLSEGIRTVLASSHEPFATEYSVILSDGTIRRLHARGQVIRNADGDAMRMVGINIDVTALFEAEQARDRLISMLETERSRLTEIIEALPVGVAIVDAKGSVILANTMIKRFSGPIIDPMEVAPHGEWIAYGSDGSRLKPDDYPIQRALRLGETTLSGVEFLFRDVDGSETWFRVGSIPLRRENGSVLEALAVFLDIGAEKGLLDIQQQINARLEQRVREEVSAREAAQQRAAHAERMHALGQIAGGIAHDFNNVLQAVSGGAALIERRPEDAARVLRNARLVLDAARRGAAITSRLLAFSRRGDLRAENVDVAALLADMAEVLTHTLGGSVVCTVDVPSGLPPLFADRGQLETVLVNLATNARDAMPSGGTLSFSASSEIVSASLPHPVGLPPGSFVRIDVADTGSGMDRAVLARVAEPFFTTKEPGRGTGLGLAMAKGFVEQSGGSLSIDSVVGRGTRVILWLPAAAHGAGGLRMDRPPGREPASSKPRILLVDDDGIVRNVLKLSLEDAGYSVHAAEGGAAALAWLARPERVDIIVTDLNMPDMDGVTMIRRAQEQRPNLPAILLTGYAGDGAALAVGGAVTGAFSLLRKPISGAQLVDRIHALLASKRQASGV